MTVLGDFLKEKGIALDAVCHASAAAEALTVNDRELRAARSRARTEKKSVVELGLEKPPRLGRSLSTRTLSAAVQGQRISRLGRKKILRAVNALLAGQSADPVEARFLFSDAPRAAKPAEDAE
jgi:hypothetical protein